MNAVCTRSDLLASIRQRAHLALTAQATVEGTGLAIAKRVAESAYLTRNKQDLLTNVLLLSHLLQLERQLLRRFDAYKALLDIVLPEEIAQGAHRLIEDEVHHVDLGQRLSARIHRQYAGELAGSRFRLSMRHGMARRSSSELQNCFRLPEALGRIYTVP